MVKKAKKKACTDVSGTPIGTIFKGQAVQEESLYRRFGKSYRYNLQGSRSPRRKPVPTFRETYRYNLQGSRSPRRKPVPTFREILSVQSSRVKKSKKEACTDVSGNPIGIIFKGQEVQEGSLYRRFGKSYRYNIQGSRSPRRKPVPTFREILSV
jgi:patatin-like phospholipase/acyl hydrolase